ncbi:hypothetical protein RIF29_18737 [Crotalaria pallida]|uniref:Secreted protein n=1 Tax=Crotalaria pallida TaxID=3830 RepID=A0AAN9EYP9_CROPI
MSSLSLIVFYFPFLLTISDSLFKVLRNIFTMNTLRLRVCVGDIFEWDTSRILLDQTKSRLGFKFVQMLQASIICTWLALRYNSCNNESSVFKHML